MVCQVTGLPGRHLDAWLMPPEVCRGLFVRAAWGAELSVVEGTLEDPIATLGYGCCDRPGDLRPIAESLDLPIVAVVSCRGSETGTFHLPQIPEGVDAILLDRLTDPAALPRLKQWIRLTTKLPVLGAVAAMPGIRAVLEQVPHDRHLPEDLIEALARSFLEYVDWQVIHELIGNRPWSRPVQLSGCSGRDRRRGFRVAYAQDQAFGRYFPDTIEALEALGADLVEFSPLCDEALPEGVDLVMIGCGFPDHHAQELASNLSMIASLGEYVCRGQRIYSEGGGTAYLGRRMIIDGHWIPGAGILPFDAELLTEPPPPVPVERWLLHDCWLGPRGTLVRGYKTGRWRLIPGLERFECPACFGALSTQADWFYHHHAVGSLLHLHLGALPQFGAAFASPHRPSLRRPSACGLSELEPYFASDCNEELEADDPPTDPEL
jgi:cobyrinic acid a,c-diamide synthase